MTEGLPTVVIHGSQEAPAEWEEAGTVEKLYIYPMKSARGIPVQEAKATPTGLRTDLFADHQFMVIDSNRRFITGRRYPKLVLIQTHVKRVLNSDQLMLTLEAPDEEKLKTLQVTLPHWDKNKLVDTEVFGVAVQGQDLGQAASAWLSKLLVGNPAAGFRLIWHQAQGTTRVTGKEFGHELFPFVREDYVPLFADGFPYLLLSQQSLDDLNQRLKVAEVDLTVEERRFRPNIFVKDVRKPFAEDSWTYIKINDVVFRNGSLCGRCIFTTVDPCKGEKDSRQEPLRTLRTFRTTLNPKERRKYGTTPFFAINLGLEQAGTIRTGDKIFIGKTI